MSNNMAWSTMTWASGKIRSFTSLRSVWIFSLPRRQQHKVLDCLLSLHPTYDLRHHNARTICTTYDTRCMIMKHILLSIADHGWRDNGGKAFDGAGDILHTVKAANTYDLCFIPWADTVVLHLAGKINDIDHEPAVLLSNQTNFLTLTLPSSSSFKTSPYTHRGDSMDQHARNLDQGVRLWTTEGMCALYGMKISSPL
jgi:hypothetical protein